MIGTRDRMSKRGLDKFCPCAAQRCQRTPCRSQVSAYVIRIQKSSRIDEVQPKLGRSFSRQQGHDLFMMCDVSVSGTSKKCLDGRPGHGPRSGVLSIILRRPLTRKIGVLRHELPVCRGLSGSHGASFACYLFLQIFWIMRYPTDSVHVVAWPAVAADCDTTTSWVAPLGRPGSCLGLPILGCFCG
jgi:hypothetical protein